MKSTLFLLAVCYLFFACNKGTSDNQLLRQCDNSQYIDSTGTATKLIGSWRLVQQRLGSNGEVVMADKIVIATFNSDSTFTVMENSVITAQGNWKLYTFSDNTWALNLTSPSNYLYGAISFCNNKVLFTDSWVDGNDNLFEKAD